MKKRKKKLRKIKGVCFLSCLALVGLFSFYIYQINAEVSEKYLIENLQKRAENLSQENKELEISSVEVGSLANIIQVIEQLDFEKTNKVEYIQVVDTQVVKR